jgi:cupin fold WbuC family metalloprotein
MDRETKTGLKRLDGETLELLSRRALSSPRKRAHHNLHPRLEDPVQRFCIAAGSESFFRPHRHPDGGKWELFLALRGRAAVLTFDHGGTVLERAEIGGGGPVPAVEISPGAWHTLTILEEDTLLFEIKPGPYLSLTDKDFASWAPAENSPSAGLFATWLRTAEPGDSAPLLPARS